MACDSASTPASVICSGDTCAIAACAHTSMCCRCASAVAAVTSSGLSAAYSLMAVAPVPRASATACRRSVVESIERIPGSDPGTAPALACAVRGSLKKAGPAQSEAK